MTEPPRERDHLPSSEPGPGSTLVPVGVLSLAALLAAACGEEAPQGPASEAGGPASVAVTASGGSVADREVAFDGSGGGGELSLELTLEDDRVPATVELALRRGADRLFEGSTELTLVAGEIGTGESFTASLPAGPHTITLTATNDRGASDEASVGITVEEPAPEPVQATAYVPNDFSHDVSVIDVASNTLSTTFPTIGPEPNPVDIAFTPGGGKAYMPQSGACNVAVVDPVVNSVTSTFSVACSPQAVAIAPGGNKAFVVSAGFSSDQLSVIDVPTNTVTTTMSTIGSPVDVAITPDGTTAYVTGSEGEFSVIDVGTNTVTTTLTLTGSPREVAIAPDGSEVYVADAQDGDVQVIDPSTNAVTSTISTGGTVTQPDHLAVAPDGSTAYVTGVESLAVAVVDLTAGAFSTNISLPGASRAEELAVTPGGAQVYVAGSNQIHVIDRATATATGTIPVGDRPSGFGFVEN